VARGGEEPGAGLPLSAAGHMDCSDVLATTQTPTFCFGGTGSTYRPRSFLGAEFRPHIHPSVLICAIYRRKLPNRRLAPAASHEKTENGKFATQVVNSPTCGGCKSKNYGKWKILPEFGLDIVARGSSGLKPLRRRAPAPN